MTADHDALLTDLADQLIPEAFHTPTRAELVAFEPIDLTRLPRPEAEVRFERWIDDRLLEALERAAYGAPLTLVTTSDGRLLRRYADCGCGGLECAVDAAQLELRAIGSPWLLAVALQRPRPRWAIDADVEELVAPDDLRWVAPWYAEARSRGVASVRAGMLLLEGEVVDDAVPVDPRELLATRLFRQLLLRHPARRRHPRRGR